MNDQQKQDSNGEHSPTETIERKKETTPPTEVENASLEEQTQQSKESPKDGAASAEIRGHLSTTDDAPPPPDTVVATTNGDDSSKPSPNLTVQPLTASPATMNTMNNYERAFRDIDIAQRELNLLAQQQQQLLLFARQQQQQQMAAFAPPFGAGGGPGFPNPFEQLYAAQRGLPTSLESMAALQSQQQQQHFNRMSGLMGFPPPMNNPYFANRQYGAAAGANLDPVFPPSSSSSAAAMMTAPYSSAQQLQPWSLSDSAEATRQAAAALMGKQPSDKASLSSSSKHGPIIIMKQKPKRPLSAYNIFFKDQRAKMNEELAYSEEHGGEEKKEDDDDEEIAPTDGPEQKLGDKRKMAVTSTSNNNKAGRKKVKKVGFATLAKTIGPLWKTLDAKTLEFYQAQADKEKERYRQECTAYQRYQETEWETQQRSLEATIDDSAKQRYFSANKQE